MSGIPYSGNPRGPGSTDITSTVIQPNDADGWAASSFNPAYMDLADDVACLDSKTFAGRNWHDTKTWTGSIGPCAMAWLDAPGSQTWLTFSFGTGGTTTSTPFTMDGTGDAPVAAATFNSPQILSIASNPTTGDVVAVGWGLASPFAFFAFRAAAGNLATFAGDTLVDPITTPTDAKVAFVAGTFVVAIASSTAGNAELGTLLVPVSGGVAHVLGGLSVQAWSLKSNGSTCVALPVQVAGAAPIVYSTTNGTAWTASNLAAVLATTDTPIDVAWSANKQLWIMAVSVAENQTRFVTSPDGITWTAIGTTLTSGNVGAIVASGSYWVATFNTAISSTWKVIFSPDGLSWYSENARLTWSGGLLIASSPTQLVVWPMGANAANLPYRFSLEAGLPDEAVT